MSIQGHSTAMRWLFFLVLLLVAGFAATGALYVWAHRPLALPEARPEGVEVIVAPGSGVGGVAMELRKSGIEVPETLFKLVVRAMGASGRLKAGAYAIGTPLSPVDIINKMVRGDVIQVDVVIPEGWTFAQFRARLDAHPGLVHETKALSDADILIRLNAPEKHPEGLFFPDTYRVDRGASDLVVLRKAYRLMQEAVHQAWAIRTPGLPLRSPYEMLILASIIEKETGQPADRPMIGSVFINRLRKGMLLQTDPTVIYGMGVRFDGNLRKSDLQTDTPYNTYTRSGLPPTPIALPGRASLEAATRPALSDALYFVARGDGSSAFSGSLDAHNRAVNRYQRNRQGQ